MPELPDLEIFSRNLSKKLKGKELEKIRVVQKRKLNVSPSTLKKSLEGQVLKKIAREGKELHFSFDNGKVLGLHLMLHGRLHWFDKKNKEKNAILELVFEGNRGLVITDFQKAATPTLDPEEKDAPDALSSKTNYRYLKEQLSRKKTNIKNFLMDQKIIRGIGNAYADEILWDAGISPLSICNKIPDQKIRVLSSSIKSVLKDALKQINKLAPGSISGEVREFLKIHNAKKKKSPTGGTIKSQMLNGRITYFTREQEEYR